MQDSRVGQQFTAEVEAERWLGKAVGSRSCEPAVRRVESTRNSRSRASGDPG